MNKNSKNKWQIRLGLVLLALSVVFYYLHYFIFRDSHHIFIYLLGDIAFVPVEVLLVTLIIHSLLNAREKKAVLEKMNMVIGVFFSKAGTDLLRYFALSDPEAEKIRQGLSSDGDWTGSNLKKIKSGLRPYAYNITADNKLLEKSAALLKQNQDFFLRLLENPMLLEHDSFTSLLWAVFHLSEEVSRRESLSRISSADREHLAKDMQRVYALLTLEWIDYMEYLNSEYPYLFSLALRLNPFDPEAGAEITE